MVNGGNNFESLDSSLPYKHVVQENMVDDSSMIGFLLVIADSEQDIPGIEPGPLCWHISILTN